MVGRDQRSANASAWASITDMGKRALPLICTYPSARRGCGLVILRRSSTVALVVSDSQRRNEVRPHPHVEGEGLGGLLLGL
eukprot:3386471-Pyramimonas_sp.AAC.1